jgi:hypothetical protein
MNEFNLSTKISKLDLFKSIQEKAKREVNHTYLVLLTFSLVMSSALQGGWAINENGQVGYILD